MSCSARSGTCRRSRRSASRSTFARTSSRSDRFCTRWSRASARLRGRAPRRRWRRSSGTNRSSFRRSAPASPVPLRWIVDRCLAKDREERYGSTKDLARDLARLRDGVSQGNLSSPASAVAPSSRRSMRRGLALTAAAALAAGISHRHRRDAKAAAGPAGIPPPDLSPRGHLQIPFRARRRNRPVHRRLAGASGAALFHAPRQHGVHRAPAPERNRDSLDLRLRQARDSARPKSPRDRRGVAGGRGAARARGGPVVAGFGRCRRRGLGTGGGPSRGCSRWPARVSRRKGARARFGRRPGARPPILARRTPDRVPRETGPDR